MRFHIGDLLTVTTGRLVSPSHMDGLYRLVDYMTGVSHYTHQLPRVADACAPALRDQHPWLTEISVPENLSGETAVTTWLSGIVERYGETHEVQPLSPGTYAAREPLAEMLEMVGDKPVIVVAQDARHD